MSPSLRISVYLIRPSSDPKVQEYVRGFDGFDWRPCTCVRCGGHRFDRKRPRTFVSVAYPEFDHTKTYGVCRRCEKATDADIMNAASVYVQKLLGGDQVTLAH